MGRDYGEGEQVSRHRLMTSGSGAGHSAGSRLTLPGLALPLAASPV